ncbi:HAD family hydrolase [Streptomyces sp. ICN441]|uniref:HAD family hydrolase n=1 Tax=Streptomyces sp. ICN441 TaxID=2558286 RepID=UPI00141B77A1|nr:HAD family hydrolase [Streptomyces sp. ICN441]
MTATGKLRHVLDQAESVLLDFDGPICRVFSAVPAAEVAERLRRTYAETYGAAAQLARGDDPLEVVRQGSIQGVPHIEALETMLTDLELTAVELAEPTTHAEEAIEALLKNGHHLAAVSNNSTAAVRRYLELRGIEAHVSPVIGREGTRVPLMKPSPAMVSMALQAHGVPPENAVFVGDSVTDIEAARAAGTMSIGYANKPGKAERLGQAGATVVIEDMAELIQDA